MLGHNVAVGDAQGHVETRGERPLRWGACQRREGSAVGRVSGGGDSGAAGGVRLQCDRSVGAAV
eukprot:2487378-Prymnesium_polylepis.1